MSLKSAQEEHDRRWAAYNAGGGPRPEPRHDDLTLIENPPCDVDGRPMWHGGHIERNSIPAPPSHVDRPPHYTAHPSGIEAIQVCEHMGFCLGNAIKYIWRAYLKGDPIENLRKAKWYIDREIAKAEKRVKYPEEVK